jgi:hypothetical protein
MDSDAFINCGSSPLAGTKDKFIIYRKVVMFRSVCFLLLLCSFGAFAEDAPEVKFQNNQAQIPTELYTPEVAAAIAKAQAQNTLGGAVSSAETASKWVGVGREVGQAINEGLLATVDAADKFSKTNVGLFTMIMIAYSIIGGDVLGIAVGLVIFLVLTIVLVWSYWKNCTTRKILVSYDKTTKLKTWMVVNDLQESRTKYNTSGGVCPLSALRIFHGIAELVILIICGFIMF